MISKVISLIILTSKLHNAYIVCTLNFIVRFHFALINQTSLSILVTLMYMLRWREHTIGLFRENTDYSYCKVQLNCQEHVTKFMFSHAYCLLRLVLDTQ